MGLFLETSQKFLTAGTCMLMGASSFDGIIPVLREQHCLPIVFHAQFQGCLFLTFKASMAFRSGVCPGRGGEGLQLLPLSGLWNSLPGVACLIPSRISFQRDVEDVLLLVWPFLLSFPTTFSAVNVFNF